MKTLSHKSLRKAEEFLQSQARPLEQALFAFFMRGAPVQWALDELAAFQNSDGGFGHGLEPDLQVHSSSILATSVALQHLRELKAKDDHPLVLGAMRYLMDTYDSTAQAWPFVPPEVVDAPRAPWWQYNDDLSQYLANPRAEIVGYLFDYSELASKEMRSSLLTAAIDLLKNAGRQLKMHEILCYARLVATVNLPEDARKKMLALMQPLVGSEVEMDPNAWDSYVLKPLQIAPSPDSLFFEQLRTVIDLNLDFEISRQQEDGSWAPNWSWGEAYPEAWPHAKRAWQGVLTVNTVKSLFAFGRVEQV